MVCRAVRSGAFGAGLFVLIVACFAQTSASFGQAPAQAEQAPATSGQAEKIAGSTITYKIIGSEGEGYGYDIIADGKTLIHQPGIPGQPGIKGFRTRSDSEKVAQLVVKKLKNREMPPTVSEEELRTLRAID
jgi:hypothetical protein